VPSKNLEKSQEKVSISSLSAEIWSEIAENESLGIGCRPSSEKKIIISNVVEEKKDKEGSSIREPEPKLGFLISIIYGETHH